MSKTVILSNAKLRFQLSLKRSQKYELDAFFIILYYPDHWGTGIRGLMRGVATLTQGNQELLVLIDKVGRPPVELGVSKSIECGIFRFSALTLLVGR